MIVIENFMDNGQLFLRARRVHGTKTPAPLRWRTHDLNGNQLPPPDCIRACSPNNWLRRLIYFFKLRREWRRRV